MFCEKKNKEYCFGGTGIINNNVNAICRNNTGKCSY